MHNTRFKGVQTTQEILITLVLLLSIILIGHSTVRAQESFPPLPEAQAALESDEDVTVSKVTVSEWPEGSDFYYTFEPTHDWVQLSVSSFIPALTLIRNPMHPLPMKLHERDS